MEKLKIYEICHNDEQLAKATYTPYLNKDCTVFFENSVIAKLIMKGEHLDCEYFGVFGPRFKAKVKSGPGPRINPISLFDGTILPPFTYYDILGMVQYQPHNPTTYWKDIHPRLNEFFIHVLYRLGIDWVPEVLEHNFYSNLFIARSEIYERYVFELLNPAMKVMEGMPELMENSGYPCPLPTTLKEKWNVSHYPYQTFICERLFSYFVHVNKFNVSYY